MEYFSSFDFLIVFERPSWERTYWEFFIVENVLQSFLSLLRNPENLLLFFYISFKLYVCMLYLSSSSCSSSSYMIYKDLHGEKDDKKTLVLCKQNSDFTCRLLSHKRFKNFIIQLDNCTISWVTKTITWVRSPDWAIITQLRKSTVC